MLALGYTITFIVPYIAGAVWDATHLTASALIPGVAGRSAGDRRRRHLPAHAGPRSTAACLA